MDTFEMKKVLERNKEIARQELQNVLDKITIKEPFQLTSYEKGFLKARVDYLKPEEKAKFKELFEPPKEDTKYPIKKKL